MQLIWLGEVVEYKGRHATVMGIDIPHLHLAAGKEEPEKVHFSEVKKIKRGTSIHVGLN